MSDEQLSDEAWDLRIYVAGQTPRSVSALNNLKRLCEEHLAGRYRIELIDLRAQPDLAVTDGIVAIPTIVRNPPPSRKIVGDLSNTERAMDSLEFPPKDG